MICGFTASQTNDYGTYYTVLSNLNNAFDSP